MGISIKHLYVSIYQLKSDRTHASSLQTVSFRPIILLLLPPYFFSDSKDVDAKETLELANTNESSVSEPKGVRVNPKGKAPKMTADNDDDEGSDDDGNFAEDSDEDDDEVIMFH